MSRIARLAELESLGRPLDLEERREANEIRRRMREYKARNEVRRHLYWTDPQYRRQRIDEALQRRHNRRARQMEAAR